MNYNIKNYIDKVRINPSSFCKEQLLLCDFIENIFNNEDIYVDEKQLDDYLKLQKYFPFKLFDWEVFCFTLHNCTYKQDGTLRFPDLFILVGRGAGKNGYLSFEDFCLLTPVNGIKYYNIDICANNEEQAKTTFTDIYNVLEDNESKLKHHFFWNKEVIRNLKTGSELRFRTSNAKTKDGGRPGKIDFDEYHQYQNYDSIQVFKTGLGKKKHPRTSITTTNGNVRDGPLDHLIGRSEQILKGAISDNGLIPFICKLDDIKEIDNKEKWNKANPSLCYNKVLFEQMEREYIDYLLDKVGNSAFVTKRMNIPQGQHDVEVTSWNNILATNKEMINLEGKTCVWSIDYAKTTDFVAVGLLFKVGEIYYFMSHSFVCSSSKELERIKAPLAEWEKDGLLSFVDDVEINPDIPVEWILKQAEKYNIIMGAMDLYRHTLLANSLKKAGFTADKKVGNIKLIRPSDQMMIAPTITSVFTNQKIKWGDNPLMRWYTNNSKQIIDSKGNITYGKIEPKSRKTDGFMAFVGAMTLSYMLDDYCYEDDEELGVYTY